MHHMTDIAAPEQGPGTAREHLEVAVIGGGQAGLAAGRFLARQGRRFAILEAAGEPAAAWARRWDSLRLFTPVRHSSLPGLPFPGDPASHPHRDDVVEYLTEYARRFELPVRLGSGVRRLRRDRGGYALELGGRTLLADQVIVATGPFQEPVVPPAAAGLDAAVAQVHSSAYRNPAGLPGETVAVVGGGNTGHQIAAELAAAGRRVHLAIGSRQAALPQRLLGRDLFDVLGALGAMRVTADSRLGRRMSGRELLVGSSPRSARRAGIALHGRVTGARGRELELAGCGRLAVDAVVWATGFRRDHSWADADLLAADGTLAHRRGVTAAPGLYVLGMPWQHTRGSALLGWVGADARHVAGRVALAAGDRTAA